MKKFFLIGLLVVLLGGFAFSFEKGFKGVGGSMSFDADDSSEYYPTEYSISLSQAVSYFVFDNICLDLAPSFAVRWAEDMDTYVSFGIGIGGRYFYKMFYAGFAFRYEESGTKGRKYSAQYLDLKAGRLFGIAKNVYIDLSIVYLTGLGDIETPHGSIDNENKQLRVGAGFAIFFK